jgi:hypothetical protein
VTSAHDEFTECLEETYQKIQKYDLVFVMGDFNAKRERRSSKESGRKMLDTQPEPTGTVCNRKRSGHKQYNVLVTLGHSASITAVKSSGGQIIT